MQYTEFIRSVLIEAGEIAKKSFGKVKGLIKNNDTAQVVTKTDLEIGKLIKDKIGQAFPTHNIIDEEYGVIDHKSEDTWVVDPLDGTANFAAGIPAYGIMLGFINGANPIAGGLILPAFDELYLAEKGKGTVCNNLKVKVSQEKNLHNSLIAYGVDGLRNFPEQTRKESRMMAEIIINIRNLRISNSCYDFALVASGKYGAYLNRNSKIWDNIAPHIIIEEAGGIYTDFWGRPMDYSDPVQKVSQNCTYCAGAPELHRQLQEIIHLNNT